MRCQALTRVWQFGWNHGCAARPIEEERRFYFPHGLIAVKVKGELSGAGAKLMRLVMKFGGTSVGNAERIAQVAEIVRAQVARGDQVIVVLSAMSGVTNALLACALDAANGNIANLLPTRGELHRRHSEVIAELVTTESARVSLREVTENTLDGFEDLCSSIFVLGESTPRGRDAVASVGERLIVPIVSQVLRECGLAAKALDATQLIVTDEVYGAADPLMDVTRDKARDKLLPILAEGAVPVTTGFIGATRAGIVTTLGRGGSDFTATILGSALDADQVWIWTDVNGVMTTDPRVVPDANTLPEISYAEAAELAYFGAKVIHPKTILPAAEKNIPIRILNSFNPSHAGTLIVRDPHATDSLVKAITAIRNLSIITVEGRGMIGVPGVAGRVFTAVAREQVNVLMISQSSSEQNICFLVETHSSDRAINSLQREFELERLRQNIERIWAQDQVVIVAVVGAGMKGTPGIAARVFGALAEKGINIIALAQGSSEYNLSLVLDQHNADESVRAIHAAFHKLA
jgi:aspartokinase/homoserine dehydrogenase 1